MATLKSDLDDYLLQNESRRSTRFTLPFSKPTFLSRSNEETPTSTNSSWFQEVQKEYFTLVSNLLIVLSKCLLCCV